MTTDLHIAAKGITDQPGDGAWTDEIEALATQLRIRSIVMSDRAGSGHPTSAMSAADLVAVLMARHLRLDTERPDQFGNDRLVVSKGHASPLLYAALDAMGILDGVLDGGDLVDAYRRCGSILEGHPTPLIPGVPAATGSLGLGLSIGAGIATAHRLGGASDARVWVLCGDSELAEGSNWEAIEHAAAEHLAGLTTIVDVNRLGQTGPTRHGWDTDAYVRRFEAFGWDTITVDGHDLATIDLAFSTARTATTPTAIIARTVKGHGADETSDEPSKHGKPLDDPEAAIRQLGHPNRQIRVTPARATLRSAPDIGGVDPELPRWDVGGDPVATRKAFGEALVAIGRSRDDIVVIDGEVKNSTGTATFADEVPERFIEAYIAEQLMTGLAVGLDSAGWRPVVATFGAFLTRAHDVLRMASAAVARRQLWSLERRAVVGPAPGDSATGRPAQTRRLDPRRPSYPCARSMSPRRRTSVSTRVHTDTVVPIAVCSMACPNHDEPGVPMDALRMTRCESVDLLPDPCRVITKPFVPGGESPTDGPSRIQVVVERIAAMSDRAVADTLANARAAFAGRHPDLEAVWNRSHGIVTARLAHEGRPGGPASPDRQCLMGAYFTHEYSIEAAALGNPSIVVAPDQSGLAAGEVRFVLSLRAVGEGHISSVEFRTGVIDADASIRLDPTGRYAVTGDKTPHAYDKDFFTTKLGDLAMLNDVEALVLDRLQDRFTITELEAAIEALDDDGVEPALSRETTKVLHWLASSNYSTSFPPSVELSERVLFPSGPTESHGMEDARFVRFVGDDGEVTYFATYTAFDGHQILPQLLETEDFSRFRVSTLTGRAAHNKGMAIFPRRIDGQFVALGRQDNVNNFVMRSPNIRVWRDATVIQEPERPWELMQLGNCGSPLETEAGWLVITHGVGPMRSYALGALLLDLHDPSRVIGHLKEPLLCALDDEREGYVPNVVYSCGSMIHGDHLVVPYGYADTGARIATVRVDDLLSRLTSSGR